MAETIEGGRYLSSDGVTYHDANGKPIEDAIRAALQAAVPRAPSAPALPVETLVQQTERVAKQNMSPRKA